MARNDAAEDFASEGRVAAKYADLFAQTCSESDARTATRRYLQSISWSLTAIAEVRIAGGENEDAE